MWARALMRFASSNAMRAGAALHGYEVDDAARAVITRHGYGDYFVHRTGHSIGEDIHGNGANMDNFETRDHRRIVPGTCFSVEPGIYLTGWGGIRIEDDVLVSPDGCEVLTHVPKDLTAMAAF